MDGVEGLSRGATAGDGTPGEDSAPDTSPYTRADRYDLCVHDYASDLEFHLGADLAVAWPVLDIGCRTGRMMMRAPGRGAIIDSAWLGA